MNSARSLGKLGDGVAAQAELDEMGHPPHVSRNRRQPAPAEVEPAAGQRGVAPREVGQERPSAGRRRLGWEVRELLRVVAQPRGECGGARAEGTRQRGERVSPHVERRQPREPLPVTRGARSAGQGLQRIVRQVQSLFECVRAHLSGQGLRNSVAVANAAESGRALVLG
jgi:hypothetical protein